MSGGYRFGHGFGHDVTGPPKTTPPEPPRGGGGVAVQVVDHGVATVFPRVQGRCPSCRGASLFLAAEGYVTCSRLDCGDPCAASRALEVEGL